MSSAWTQTLTIGSCTVEVREPTVPVRRVLVLLPGWNYTRRCWCDSSRICSLALAKGYRLILLEMGKSIYASATFPETRRDWRAYPTLRTLLDTVFTALQENGYLWPGRSFLMGLSTGGRGVVMILSHTGQLFRAGAALSGDFDPHLDPRDALLTGWYGPYGPRWESTDNPLRLSERIQVPLFLAHGQKDRIVPYQHSRRLYEHLKAKRPDLLLVYREVPDAGHDFSFWERAGEWALTFFDEL
jgi:dipeptidyl aminopeptidase/acylaminoacyl peptidase